MAGFIPDDYVPIADRVEQMCQVLHDEGPMTNAEIAAHFGVTTRAVGEWLRLAKSRDRIETEGQARLTRYKVKPAIVVPSVRVRSVFELAAAMGCV